MPGLVEALRARVAPILRRYARQNDASPPTDAAVDAFVRGLARVIAERGLPRPLAPGEVGRPAELPDEDVRMLLDRTLPRGVEPWFSDAAKQLVKACFYPEFTTCRDSFRATSADGSCRRQDTARVRKRVSGAHCVDCPHWLALSPDEHAQLLRASWRGPIAEFAAHGEVFLPEDFRAFRRWIRQEARRASAG